MSANVSVNVGLGANGECDVNLSALFMTAMPLLFCGFWHATKVMH